MSAQNQSPEATLLRLKWAAFMYARKHALYSAEFSRIYDAMTEHQRKEWCAAGCPDEKVTPAIRAYNDARDALGETAEAYAKACSAVFMQTEAVREAANGEHLREPDLDTAEDQYER